MGTPSEAAGSAGGVEGVLAGAIGGTPPGLETAERCGGSGTDRRIGGSGGVGGTATRFTTPGFTWRSNCSGLITGRTPLPTLRLVMGISVVALLGETEAFGADSTWVGGKGIRFNAGER